MRILLLFMVIFQMKNVTSQGCEELGPIYTHDYNISPFYYVICKHIKFDGNLDVFDVQPPSKRHPQAIYKYIFFDQCQLPVLPYGLFSKFGNVSEIRLKDSAVEEIIPGTFNGMVLLNVLSLRQNKISNITVGTFAPLINLKELDLSHNSLYEIADNLFDDLALLDDLNLSFNYLVKISQFALRSLLSLQVLDISHNNLYRIEANSFAHLINLEMLILNHNYIVNIPTHLFDNTKKLTVLNVSTNSIKDIQCFTQLSNSVIDLNLGFNDLQNVKDWSWLNSIKRINIKNNNLSDIDLKVGVGIENFNSNSNNLKNLDFIFDSATDLIILDLSENIIEEIHENTFNNLTKLETLFLSYNQISNLEIGCFNRLRSLQELRLSFNSLTKITYGTFSGLQNLNYLFLDNNQIVTLHESSFYVLQSLHALYLTNNKIRRLDSVELVLQLKELKTIGLNGNDWFCSTLFHIRQIFGDNGVTILNGTDYNEQNINGIACDDSDDNWRSNFDEEHKNVPEFLQRRPNNKENEEEAKNYNDYDNSSFYNHLQRNFKKTKFYKFFGGDFINSSFFQYFENGYKNSALYKSLNGNFVVTKSDDDDYTDESNETFGHYERLTSNTGVNSPLNEEIASFTNKISVCVMINVSLLFVMILLFLFLLFRKDRKNQKIPKFNESNESLMVDSEKIIRDF